MAVSYVVKRIRSNIGLAVIFAIFATISGFISRYLYKGVGSTKTETSLAEKNARLRLSGASFGFGAASFIGVVGALIGLYQAFGCYRNPENCI